MSQILNYQLLRNPLIYKYRLGILNVAVESGIDQIGFSKMSLQSSAGIQSVIACILNGYIKMVVKNELVADDPRDKRPHFSHAAFCLQPPAEADAFKDCLHGW